MRGDVGDAAVNTTLKLRRSRRRGEKGKGEMEKLKDKEEGRKLEERKMTRWQLGTEGR